MEIPENITSLYRHWDLHASNEKQEVLQENLPAELLWFIEERIRIWEKKISKQQLPYTQDSILARYRFCNIFREFDRQTIEFHTLLNPLRDNFPLWLLNMFYFRLVARTETIKAAGPLSLNKRENEEVYTKLISLPRPRFGTPYVFPISTIHKSTTPTRELFITRFLPNAIPRVAREIRSWREISVYDGVARILPLFGVNLSFLWTEALIDVAYQFPLHVSLWKKFPIGPGSLPTWKKLIPRGDDPRVYVEKLGEARMPTSVTYEGRVLRLSPENWEGIGCEFRKYKNLQEGRGRKRRYQ